MKKINSARDLGITIRSKRKKNQLTQENLAGVAGVGVRFISDLERGKETCEIGKALRIVKMLGLTLSIAESVRD